MEKLQIDDFTRYKFLSGIEHSPDGKFACFVIHQCNLQNNNYRSNLWLLNIETDHSYQLTSFDKEKSFLWLDNETILFPSLRDPEDQKKSESDEDFTQYYRISIHGGEAIKSFWIPRQVSCIKQVDPDTYLFVAEFNATKGEQAESHVTSEEEADRNEEKDYSVFEEIPFWENGDGITSKKRKRLYSYSVQSNRFQAITDEQTNVEYFDLNKDKLLAVIVATSFRDKAPLTNDILVYDLKTKQLKQISKPATMRHEFAGFLADSLIFTGSDMKNYGVNENQRFYIFKSDSPHCITPALDVSITNSVGSDCRYGGSQLVKVAGDYVYFVSTEGHRSILNRVDCNGSITRLTTIDGSVDGFSVKADSFLYIGMKTDQLQELFKQDQSAEKQITRLNEWVQTDRAIASAEKLTVETESEVLIDGWVIKPNDFDPEKRYPAILSIHGGPKTVYGEVFYHDMQYWASHGYAVFFCNPRGSDGKGNDFADIRGKYGTIDYDDVMKFTDAALAQCSFIDQNRLGVTGGSYGGFMVNWIIGHTKKFKAAVSERSISNWISKFCTTDIGYFFVDDQIRATPWTNQEKLWEHSPLKYADKVETPTLFIHSDEDYRCWQAEGIQMFTALKFHRIESRLCLFKGENHELSRSGKPKHRLRRLREITEWFDRHLKE